MTVEEVKKELKELKFYAQKIGIYLKEGEINPYYEEFNNKMEKYKKAMVNAPIKQQKIFEMIYIDGEDDKTAAAEIFVTERDLRRHKMNIYKYLSETLK